MVKKFLRILSSEMSGMHETAYLLGFFTILSQVLGLLRDRMLAHIFGAGQTLDVYYAAFRLPDLIFVSVASLVSISVLVPFLIEKLDVSREEGQKFIQNIFSFFSFLIIFVTLVAFFLVPYITRYIFPGLTGKEAHDLVVMSRILLLSPLLLGFSNFFASITQVYKRFVMFALSPLLYNLGIILGIVVLYPMFGLPGLAFGVVLGALLHCGIQLPYIAKEKLLPRLTFAIDFKAIKKIIILSLSRTFALSATSISNIFLLSFASLMAAGSISVFNFSFNLQSVPLSIIGVSYSVALFPTLTRLFGKKDHNEFKRKIIDASRHILFLSIPITFLFVVLRAQIVRTLLGSGNFSWADTRLTAAMLALFVLSLVAQNFVLLFVRAYYAAGNTKKPLIVNVCSALASVVFSFLFIHLFASSEGFAHFIRWILKVDSIEGVNVLMLALGFSLAMCLNALTLALLFEFDFKGFFKGVSRTFFETLFAALTIGFVSYELLDVFDGVFNINTLYGIFMQGFLSGILGILSGVALLMALRNREIGEITETLHKKIFRLKPLLPDPETVENL